ncbi:MAG: hypothetical protein FJW35_15745, partial [Acidobacteria bacterium]|nr:hypothetical protein [Acidobacteriota bacterium]
MLLQSPLSRHRKGGHLGEIDSSAPRWALILGASSGFGAAACLALARHGFDIVGVHLDRRATLTNAERVMTEV